MGGGLGSRFAQDAFGVAGEAWRVRHPGGVGHAFGHRAAAAWPRASVSGRSSAGPADVAVTGYGYGYTL